MTELNHYGVLGMKWGVRRTPEQLSGRAQKKADRKATSDANYSTKQREEDKAFYGKRGVKGIEKRVGKGRSVASARRREVGARVVKGLAIAGALNTAANIMTDPTIIPLAKTIPIAFANDADKLFRSRVHKQNAKFAKAGQEAAAAIFSDSRGLTSLNTISLSPSDYTSTTATQAKAQAAEAAKAVRDKIINDAVNADVNEQMKGWAEGIYKDKNKKRR